MRLHFLYLPLLICLIAQQAGHSQSNLSFERINYPVTVNGQPLEYSFGGGLNAPQFNVADLDHDQRQDLVLFDRNGHVVLTFINEGSNGNPKYVFQPEYAINFPDSLTDWMLLRDYDKDGIMDMFCAAFSAASQEIQLFKGYYDGHGLKFQPYLFDYPANCSVCNELYVFYPDDTPGFWNNFPVSKGDVPNIDDIDGDGDLDIIAFVAGTSTSLTMLRNMSVENGDGFSKPIYELYDNCWGRFFENGMERCHARLSCDPDTCAINCGFAPVGAEERDNLHPGAAATTLDYDNDGDRDLLLSNVNYPCIDFMTNGNDAQKAWMTAQDTAFPSSNVPVEIYNFPAAFYLDFDQDGKKDLITALNSPTSGEDRKGVWYYRNTHPVQGQHQFELQTRSLIQEDMIDVGTAAHPAFADVNDDGLLDLVVGNYGYYSYIGTQALFTNARLFLYTNIGTPTAPAFELTSSDWLGLSQFAPNDYDFAPTFGDLDGDGDLDLLVGNNLGGVYFYRNTAPLNQPMNLQYEPSAMWLSMDVVGSISTPFIYDLDGDGLKDLLMGERAGNINFFKNLGTASNPIFPSIPTLQKIGQIDTRVQPEVVGMSCPYIIETNDGPLLITGTQRGHLEAYYVSGAIETPYQLFSERWGNLDEGFRSHPALADLNGDGMLEMVIGNQRGGLSAYGTELKTIEVPLGTTAADTRPLRIHPNPARAWVKADWTVDAPISWEVFNALGQLTASGETSTTTFGVNVSDWEPGVYVLKARAGAQYATGKLIVAH